MIYFQHSIIIVFDEKNLQLPSQHNHNRIKHLEIIHDV